MIKVYHASIVEVQKPLVALGRNNLDFGVGFYATDIRSQAERWAARMAIRRMASPVLNIYNLDLDNAKKDFNYLHFDSYDKKWLDFIVSSRNGNRPWAKYDIIEGGVANDRVIDTIEDYIRGRMSAKAALAELSKHQPNNQICLLSQAVIDSYLHFIESINL